MGTKVSKPAQADPSVIKPNSNGNSNPTLHTQASIESIEEIAEKPKNIPKLVKAIQGDNDVVNMVHTKTLRKLLCDKKGNNVHKVMQVGGFERLIELASQSHIPVRKEAILALAASTSNGTSKEVKELVEKGCILPMSQILCAPDDAAVKGGIRGLQNVLRVASEYGTAEELNAIKKQVITSDGLSMMRQLRHLSTDDGLSEICSKFIDTYFE